MFSPHPQLQVAIAYPHLVLGLVKTGSLSSWLSLNFMADLAFLELEVGLFQYFCLPSSASQTLHCI